MKLKSILALGLVGILSLTLLAGCTKKDSDNSSSTPPSSEPQSSAPQKEESGQLTAVHEAIKTAYGEDYIGGTFPVDETMLEEMYGIKKDLVKEYVVDAAAINTQVDTFIGAEAAEGKADELEAAMKAYRDKFIADKEAFPYLADHLPKAKAAQVVRVDDYVFYVMVASTFDSTEETMDKDVKDGIQKGVDTINDFFKK